MSVTERTLCVLCFEPVLGCSECDGCDANRYCPGHYFLRGQQQGSLQIEGGLFDGMDAVPDTDEFVQLINHAISMRLVRPFSVRAPLTRFRK